MAITKRDYQLALMKAEEIMRFLEERDPRSLRDDLSDAILSALVNDIIPSKLMLNVCVEWETEQWASYLGTEDSRDIEIITKIFSGDEFNRKGGTDNAKRQEGLE